MESCETDLRSGGSYRVVWRMADGEEMVVSGTYEEVVPPERLVSAESFNGELAQVETTTFTESGGKTKMEVRQKYSSKEARDACLGTGATTGMAACYDQLDVLLPTWM